MKHLPPLDSADLTWLVRLSRALLREPHAADDLVQDTLVAALEADATQPPRRSWLAAVARKLAARRIRTDVRRARREAHATPPQPSPDSSELLARAEVAEQLAAAARRLPEPFRSTVLLRFLDGLEPAEIAAREGRPVDTVRHRVRRGLALLREDLRRHDGDWAARCVLLAPTAFLKPAAGVATAGSAATATWVAPTWITMKTKLIGAAALVAITCGTIWLVGAQNGAEDPTPADGSTITAQHEAPVTDPVTPKADAAPANAVRDLVTTPPPPPVIPADAFRGEVVDEAGAPVVGAQVFAVTAAEKGELLWQTVTDENGWFHRTHSDEDHPPMDLGIVATGFLRHTEADAHRESDLRIVLQRGLILHGRVVDEFGRPVPDLPLLAHTAETRLDHVSPTQVLLRARRAQLGGRGKNHQQARATTNANGMVTFTGLPKGELRVRSTDPGWTIEAPATTSADNDLVTWTAKRRLGVELTVVDKDTLAPVEHASAKFHVELTFADGKVEPFGQWVGRGDGKVSLVLGPGCFLPSFEGRTITRAAFHGTVRSGSGEPTEWRAPLLEDGAGASGVARVRVAVDSTQVEEVIATGPTTTVELDTRYSDDTLVRGRVVVDWVVRTADGSGTRRGQEKLAATSDGRHRFSVPAGSIRMTVHEYGASGSLPAWSGELYGYADRVTAATATLPLGAIAAIQRPDDWSGDWYVHASWRPVGEERWRGSWYHGTAADALELKAMKPAEWRFLLRQGSPTEGDALQRTVVLREGVRATVDR